MCPSSIMTEQASSHFFSMPFSLLVMFARPLWKGVRYDHEHAPIPPSTITPYSQPELGWAVWPHFPGDVSSWFAGNCHGFCVFLLFECLRLCFKSKYLCSWFCRAHCHSHAFPRLLCGCYLRTEWSLSLSWKTPGIVFTCTHKKKKLHSTPILPCPSLSSPRLLCAPHTVWLN